jgi:hypothetical protein
MDMRAKEFTFEEIVYEAKFGGYDLHFTKHFFDQINKRGISQALVNNILKRLDRARKQIDDIGPETSINIYDRKEGVHIVISKPNEDENKIQLITAYKNDQYHGRNPVIPIR